ncbi:MAG: hypothetical protein WCK39_04435 [Methanomassiliicoccales archaeon]
MRRMKDAAGMLAILDAFAFLIIVASACAALPLMASEEAYSTGSLSEKTRSVHQALLGANSTNLPGGGVDLPLWRYAELVMVTEDGERSAALLAAVTQLLDFLVEACAWEWTCGQDARICGGVLSGDIYCDRVMTAARSEFTLRLAPSGGPP